MSPVIIFITVLAVYAVWALLSSRIPARNTGLSGKGTAEVEFTPCPDSPNCCSSTETRADKSIDPIAIPSGMTPESAWEKCREVIQSTPGFSGFISEEDTYLHALFLTPLMRFPDDLEVLMDSHAGQIHLKSSSRVGYSDLGKNRSRLEAVRKAFLNSGL